MRLLPALLLLACLTAPASATVEMSQYDAIPLADRIVFTWTTSRESGNYFFELWRDTIPVAQVTGQFNSVTPHSYTWSDTTITPETVYLYRLWSVGTNGYDSLSTAWIQPPHWVVVSNFRVVNGPAQVSVMWQTRSEIQNNHFEIMRDGEMVAVVTAHNRYYGSYFYAWSDTLAAPDRLYHYALVAVAADGRRDELGAADGQLPVDDAPGALPAAWSLAAYPNPFNPQTTLAFSVPRASPVQLRIFDITGREVQLLANRVFAAGVHHVSLDLAGLPSGLYFARLEAPGYSTTRKLIFAK